MELVLPNIQYKNSFIEAVKEFLAEKTPSQRHILYKKYSVAELENNFEALLSHESDKREGKNLAPDRVPSTDYWLVDNGEFIGRVSIRHRLTDTDTCVLRALRAYSAGSMPGMEISAYSSSRTKQSRI